MSPTSDDTDPTASLGSSMKRWGAVATAIAVLLADVVVVIVATQHSNRGPATLWVATTGSDSNDGSRTSPFATVQRAQQAVNELGGASSADVTVILRGGTYRMTEPLEVPPSGTGHNGHVVTYRSAPGERAVLSGARSVPGTAWTLADPTLNIWKAHVGATSTRQLYVNGARATLARTSMYPAGFRPTGATSGARSGIEFIPTPLNPSAWSDPTTWSYPAEVDAVAYDQWKMMTVPVASVTAATGPSPGLLSMAQPAWDNANSFRGKKNAPAIWGFWQVTFFENAYQFLDQPGEWYLNRHSGDLFYIPRAGETMATADVELPVLQHLVIGHGSATEPIEGLHFENLTFEDATWLAPGQQDGYVADQSGMILTGTNAPNTIGHATRVSETPGTLDLEYPRQVVFTGDIFRHLGSAGLLLGTGSQNNRVAGNLFTDISGSGIELGGVSMTDAHPSTDAEMTRDNTISGNLIEGTGAEFVDTAAIYAGFTRATLIEHNSITDVPWTGIAMGWGWGLLDPSGFPGLDGAHAFEWGHFSTPTPNAHSVIRANHIDHFLENRWDGGATYTTGQQGTSAADGLVIEGNLATNKLPAGGGNTFYTDGGTRYVTVQGNVSYDNPVGTMSFGPPPRAGDPLPYSALPSEADTLPYGSDTGGCVTYGDIRYLGNFWMQAPMTASFPISNGIYRLLGLAATYSAQGYFDPCAYSDAAGTSYPVNLTYAGNQVFAGQAAAMAIAANAGVQRRPSSIPAALWTPPAK